MDLKQDEYLTIVKSSEGLYKEKGSKFIALAFPVKTEEELKAIQLRLRKEYHDARHHCYAYRIGTSNLVYRTNDDGEPSGTAGKPIYGQIQSFQLTNILVVVIRYFGGTKLGVPGLIRAYKTATQDVFQNADIKLKTINNIISFEFEYPDLNQVMRIIKEDKPSILEQVFEMQCVMKLSIRQSLAAQLSGRLNKIKSLNNLICE